LAEGRRRHSGASEHRGGALPIACTRCCSPSADGSSRRCRRCSRGRQGGRGRSSRRGAPSPAADARHEPVKALVQPLALRRARLLDAPLSAAAAVAAAARGSCRSGGGRPRDPSPHGAPEKDAPPPPLRAPRQRTPGAYAGQPQRLGDLRGVERPAHVLLVGEHQQRRVLQVPPACVRGQGGGGRASGARALWHPATDRVPRRAARTLGRTLLWPATPAHTHTYTPPAWPAAPPALCRAAQCQLHRRQTGWRRCLGSSIASMDEYCFVRPNPKPGRRADAC